jgi:hypothetical protein
MKRLILALTFVLVATGLFTDVLVLPAGTTVFVPGEDPTKLSESSFLLTRGDLESATLALETVEIQKKAIEKLEEGWRVQKDLTILVAISTGILSFLLGAFVEYMLK